MSYSIFLDDERYPSEVTWVELPLRKYNVVRDFDAFRGIIEAKGTIPTVICWDHDLGGLKDPTGLDCAKWLVNWSMDNNIPLFGLVNVVHSMNPVGKENIEKFWISVQNFLSKNAN